VPGCRSSEEEIVVSEPLRAQGVPFGDAQNPLGRELSFSFSRELPINAWDVVLQVVYRGRLGGEEDAVVVATKDISEPTFIATYNDTDYIHLDGRCYAPATVAATEALWNQLAPVCRNESTTPRSVSAACANVLLNVRHAKWSVNPPLVLANDHSGPQDRRLPSRRFSRFAVLGERATPIEFELEASNPPYIVEGGVAQPEEFPPYKAQLSAGFDRYAPRRGVNSFNAVYFVVDGRTAMPGPQCADGDMTALAGAERFPAALEVAGWSQ
jgi:hypothetical protein